MRCESGHRSVIRAVVEIRALSVARVGACMCWFRPHRAWKRLLVPRGICARSRSWPELINWTMLPCAYRVAELVASPSICKVCDFSGTAIGVAGSPIANKWIARSGLAWRRGGELATVNALVTKQQHPFAQSATARPYCGRGDALR